jgi:3,4-dihydroxy 2-butanone 4-phosphate synthase/GTP cyclohydrolase II
MPRITSINAQSPTALSGAAGAAATSGMHAIDEILAELRAGRMVVIMDDEDRENEGDLIMAADCVRPEDINFMARFGRGLICLTLTRERCAQLRLPLMVSETDRTQRTNFTLSIEAAEGVTTGISAHDRAHTVRTAVRPDAQPEDLRQPGHVFPIMAQPGGVLTRAGHTEAGCDLARLAGFEAAAVIVEIMNDDGSMARRPELEAFAKRHQLKIGTIADLIRYRLQTERSVERIAEQFVSTDYGDFRLYCYEDHVNRDVHLALVHGDLQADTPIVRVHVTDTLRDLLGVRGGSRAWTLRAALQRIAQSPCGVVVMLRQGELPRELADAVRSLSLRSTNETPPAMSGRVLRTYGVGAQILQDLGVRRMHVLSAPKTMHGISAFGLEIVDYVGERA